jgi:hypothetical protein
VVKSSDEAMSNSGEEGVEDDGDLCGRCDQTSMSPPVNRTNVADLA